MSWANSAIEKLARGEQAQIRPRGHSMRGKVNHRDLVTLAPCNPARLEVGDIVLARVKGRVYLHLIRAIKGHNEQKRFLIGNNKGGTNGWVGGNAIFGIAIRIEA